MAAEALAIVAAEEDSNPKSQIPDPWPESVSRSELRRQNGWFRERYHDQQKRLVALRRSREACRRSNLALIEEIASLREQLQRHSIIPLASRIELPETELNAEC